MISDPVGVCTGMLRGPIYVSPGQCVSLNGFFPAERLRRGVVTGIVPIRIGSSMQCFARAQVPNAESSRNSGLKFPRHIRFKCAVRVFCEPLCFRCVIKFRGARVHRGEHESAYDGFIMGGVRGRSPIAVGPR